MTLPDYPQRTESVGRDASDGPRIQPQHESVKTHHHFLPTPRPRLPNGIEYQHQGRQQSSGNPRLYQGEEHKPEHEHQQYSQQQYYQRTHEQPYWQYQKKCSPHHLLDISQNRHSFGEPRHPSSTLAKSPSAAPEPMPESMRPSGQSNNLWSSDQARCDEKPPVPNEGVNKSTSVSVASVTEEFFQRQRGTELGDEGGRRGSRLSPTSPLDSSSARDDSTSAGSDPCQPSVRSNYTSGFQKPDATSQNPGQPPRRVRTACEECRQKKRKCNTERPCHSCQRRELPCDGRGPTSAITWEAFAIQAAKIQDLENITRDFFDKITRVMQDKDCRKDRQGSGNSALWLETERSQMPSLPQGEYAHRTGPVYTAHSWESLQELLRAADVNLEFLYVMEAEEQPSLCLYPEDEEVTGSYDTQGGTFTGSVRHHDSAPDNVFSTDDRGGRSHTYVAERRSSADGAPLDLATIQALHGNYMQYIHAVQPFLDAVEIRSLLDNFIAWHGITVQPSVANNTHDTTSNRPFKRRRQDQYSSLAPLNRSRREDSLGHAVIYLILALGKICTHDPRSACSLSTGRLETSYGPSAHMYGERSASLGLEDPDTTFRGGSQPQSAAGALRGDQAVSSCKVPGLEYYTKAVEIFGVYNDGSDLILAQLFLLAGLYKGQLARVEESMNWYVMAGRILVQLLRKHKVANENNWERTSEGGKTPQDGSGTKISNYHRSSIVRASYSCIQLESDIQAHCDLPCSGISSLETMLPTRELFTNVSGSQDDFAQSDNVSFHFASQVYLRIQLNRIHEQLYGPCHERRSPAEIWYVPHDHEAAIETWREKLPADMSWDPEDEPPTNILDAHLRANYWAARYLINRPFLDYILHTRPHPRLAADGAASHRHRNPHHEAESHLFRAIAEMSEEKVMMGCQSCVKAAEKSTIAFDNVPGHLVVTNIHGTAHAQFDSVLVLCGVYRHPGLCHLVEETALRHLLSRTISFLDRLAPLSRTCRINSQVLTKVQWLLLGIPYSEG